MKASAFLILIAGSLLAAAGSPAGAQGKPPPQAQQESRPQDKARATAAAAPYGQWDKRWGPKPSVPPAHFRKKSDWYRHVRACQRKFRSYNASTDNYRSLSGRTIRCRL